MKAVSVSGRERGATLIEYGLIVGLIAMVLIGAVTVLGGAIANFFNDLSAAL